MNCRTIFLLTFVLACTAVVAVDRYLTLDAVRLCREGNTYNLEELVQIRRTQDAQYGVGCGLKVAEAATAEMQKVRAELETMTDVAAKFMAENAALRQGVSTQFNKEIEDLQRDLEKAAPSEAPDRET